MTSLVILAAGLGSRFGGNKQLAEFGQLQLTLMEYNLIHAIEAGFDRVIFVIRPELAPLLKQQVITRLPKEVSYDIAYQSLDELPEGCHISTQRTKPLGTAHALWCCRHLINSNFAVINADDFYGKKAFSLLIQQTIKTPTHYLMVAYQLQNTLSEFGGVNRGLCKIDADNNLLAIEECEQIQISEQVISGILSESQLPINLPAKSLISMNCWFFTTDIFTAIKLALINQLSLPIASLGHDIVDDIINDNVDDYVDDNKECYLPAVVMQQIQKNNKKIKVLSTSDHWFGLTYPQDTALVNKKVTAQFIKK